MTDEVDLVVVGFGGAGAAAAIAAHDVGARVVVLEKQAAGAHTPSTRMSGGLVMAMDDAEQGAAYLDACAGGMVPMEVNAAWAARATGVLDWLQKITGTTFSRINAAEHPDLPGAASVGVHQPGRAAFRLDPSAGGGDALFGAVAAAVEQRGIEVRWSSPAARLVTEAGRVVGVRTGDRVVRARRGVVLTCGGYEFDERIKQDSLRAHPVHFYGNPGNTGDGVRMAQAVGADLWHMNQMIGRAIGHFPIDGGWLNFLIDINPPGYLIVDRHGHRYADETMQAQLLHGYYYEMLRYDYDRAEYSRIPSYWIFDERRRTAGPLTLTHLGACKVGLYDWSPDNAAEIERGWIGRGATPEEAAAAVGMTDGGRLQRRLRRRHRCVRSHRDHAGAAHSAVLLRAALPRGLQHLRRSAPRRGRASARPVRGADTGSVRRRRARPAGGHGVPGRRREPVRGLLLRADRGGDCAARVTTAAAEAPTPRRSPACPRSPQHAPGGSRTATRRRRGPARRHSAGAHATALRPTPRGWR
jgi:hypothetical protein